MRTAIYCRISRDREGAGLGVGRQEADCRSLCEERGWEVVSVHTDNDISAYSGKRRPGYAALLAEVEAGAVDLIVAWHTDRLHRSPRELETYVDACERHSVATHTVKAGELDLASASGRMVARMLGATARYEVEHSVERMRRAKRQQAESGLYRGGPRPYGYESDGKTVRQEEAARVLAASEAVLAGQSIRSLMAEWNAAGVPTVGGGLWRHTGLRRVLLRARNAGLVEHEGQVVGKAEWPAIVPEETWRGVVAVLADPGRVSTLTYARRWLGSGLYVCGQCGRPVEVGQSNSVPTYRCGPSGCRGTSRTVAPVDEYVSAGMVHRLRRGDLASVLGPADDGGAARLGGEVRALRARLDELAGLFAAGDLDAQQLATGSRLLRVQLERAEEQLGRVAQRGGLAAVAGADDPGAAWLAADLSVRRAVLDALLVVTLLPSGKGRPAGWRPGEPYFRHESVDLGWR